MPRLLNLTRTAMVALAALTPFTVPAQIQPPAERVIDRSLSWCDAKAAKPEWKRQPILLVLEEERDAADADLKSKRLPRLYLTELLDAVRKQFLEAARSSGGAGQSGTALIAADTRYHVAALWGEIAFQLRGNGTINSIVLRDVRDSTLLNPLVAALRAAGSPGALTPFGTESEVRPMTLKPAVTASKKGATWAMFTMEVPRERFVTVLKRPPMSYPPGMLNWTVDITLQFYVDTAGRTEPQTIELVRSASSGKGPDVESREPYRSFIEVSRQGVEGTLFKPAEFLGCRYRRLVSQPLEFKSRSPR